MSPNSNPTSSPGNRDLNLRNRRGKYVRSDVPQAWQQLTSAACASPQRGQVRVTHPPNRSVQVADGLLGGFPTILAGWRFRGNTGCRLLGA
jgi:hypothetical protein